MVGPASASAGRPSSHLLVEEQWDALTGKTAPASEAAAAAAALVENFVEVFRPLADMPLSCMPVMRTFEHQQLVAMQGSFFGDILCAMTSRAACPHGNSGSSLVGLFFRRAGDGRRCVMPLPRLITHAMRMGGGQKQRLPPINLLPSVFVRMIAVGARGAHGVKQHFSLSGRSRASAEACPPRSKSASSTNSKCERASLVCFRSSSRRTSWLAALARVPRVASEWKKRRS